MIKDRSAAWRPAAEEKAVQLSASATEPLTARMREGHLEQILDNLLANSLEAVPAGGHIRVSAARAANRITIVVADDGPGMSEQQRQAAFRRFVSATPGGTRARAGHRAPLGHSRRRGPPSWVIPTAAG